ncbi:hypothetical protein F5148DRAFT_1222148 [Russula earlei]|uniref:Uncharacterized protein n=1 Tax=Russula earlei TaxID=71964 RepID=A0ACC0U2F8_9AGAM|nr:hypothetical protein F5148DRAFT_1222148 [Russula earlei]
MGKVRKWRRCRQLRMTCQLTVRGLGPGRFSERGLMVFFADLPTSSLPNTRIIGMDAGEVDAGEVDAGEVDVGEVDAGEVDAGEVMNESCYLRVVSNYDVLVNVETR